MSETNEQYTQGRLHLGETTADTGSDWVGLYATDANGDELVVADAKAEDVGQSVCDANARRLAAAWNLIDGLDTEEVEQAAAIEDGPTRLAFLLVGKSKVRWPVIHAAPDLLAALSALVAHFDDSRHDHDVAARAACVDAARAAIRMAAPAAPPEAGAGKDGQ